MKSTSLLFICLLCLSSCKLIPETSGRKNRSLSDAAITGSWELISYKAIDPLGRIHFPYDKEVKGLVIFDNENKFSFQVYDATRPLLSHPDPFFCNDPEIRIAYLSGQSYFGDYSIKGDSVVFHIEADNFPNHTGKTETRYFRKKADSLLLIAPGRRLNGIFLTEHSIWINKGNNTPKPKKQPWYKFFRLRSS